jgi:hypothetical protein
MQPTSQRNVSYTVKRVAGRACAAAVPLLCAVAFGIAQAQKLPPTSRTVYRCEVASKTVYSDAPCLGARKIDVEPTRGLSKSSGRELVGADVQREHNREIFAEAVRPLTGLDAKQLQVQGRRMKLTASEQGECRRLDADIPAAEFEEKNASKQTITEVQLRLLNLRKRSQVLAC